MPKPLIQNQYPGAAGGGLYPVRDFVIADYIPGNGDPPAMSVRAKSANVDSVQLQQDGMTTRVRLKTTAPLHWNGLDQCIDPIVGLGVGPGSSSLYNYVAVKDVNNGDYIDVITQGIGFCLVIYDNPNPYP